MSDRDTATRELGAFLRMRRESLRPDADVPRGRRRTPGLRREEVAERAGVSTDYVVRLEQGRGLHPSAEVLDALAAALQLSGDERAYVVELARRRAPEGAQERSGGCAGRAVASPAARLVHDLSPLPAMLLDHRLDMLAWNPEMSALMLDLDALPPAACNAIEHCLFDARLVEFYPDREQILREGIADLRAAWATHSDDARLRELIAGWRARSPEFARLWERRDVRVAGRGSKRLNHPDLGPLTVAYEAMHPMADPHERMVIYRAADADSQRALDRLTAEVREPARYAG